MIWQPLNLTEVCPVNSHLTACSYLGYAFLNVLVQMYGDSIDRRIQEGIGVHDDTEDEEHYDFIVVGGGSAGCVVATRLSEFPDWKVLLLEAGPEQPDITLIPGLHNSLIGSNVDWGYSTEPNGKSCLAYGGRCSWPRGKMMGGSGSINSMSYIRGNRLDYDRWAALGNKGWSYEEVLPFFKKHEDNLEIEELDRKYHDIYGEQPIQRFTYIDNIARMITESHIERGLPLTDYNGAHQEGTNQAQAFARNGVRWSANTAFIQPVRYNRDNLVVKVNSEVKKVLIENGEAVGVIYERNNKKYTAYAKKEVILSAGSINSPQLLMWSGIGPREHLKSLNIPVIIDLPVGENLHDHVTYNGLLVALPNGTATTVNADELFYNVKNFFDMSPHERPLSGNGPTNSIAFLKSKHGLAAPDVQYQADHTSSWREFIKDPAAYIEVAILPASFYDGIVLRVMNIAPKSRGRLLLNPNDPYGHPLLYPNYFDDETDFLPLLRGTRFALSLEDTHAFRSKGAYFVRTPLPYCEDFEWGTDDYLLCVMKYYTSGTYHPVGTCKMGPEDDDTAVVDPELRVYGIDRLRVIDGSIMPVVTLGNTNAPCMMIGERGADFIIKYWANVTHV
ncbi:glucose dehydrogenase [FAD, quinone]-like [Colias croceus]|uniref:glucose dehydrogenase [FAD, quinone]-like n=1 Tax=Colias crocea TaxID=72248 RepID=UPI001E27F89A|nr:glucose dehydrogenase [FAD, quinone]-like [Colias croceus]